MKFHARSLFRFFVSFFLSFQLEYYIPRIGGISCLDSCTIESIENLQARLKKRRRGGKERKRKKSVAHLSYDAAVNRLMAMQSRQGSNVARHSGTVCCIIPK